MSTGSTNVECWTVDLADFKSVSAFADRFEKEGGGRLDLLLLNAGVVQNELVRTVDGWESTYVDFPFTLYPIDMTNIKPTDQPSRRLSPRSPPPTISHQISRLPNYYRLFPHALLRPKRTRS